MNTQSLSTLYKDELLNNVLPFWLTKSQDLKYGGYLTMPWRHNQIICIGPAKILLFAF